MPYPPDGDAALKPQTLASISTARRPGAGLRCLFALALCWPAVAAAGARAPSFLLFDSYFPSWLVGAFAAIPLTLVVRHVLIRAGIDDVLPWRLFVYVCLGLLFTMAFAYYFSPR